MNIIFLFLAFLIGISNTVQSGVNAGLRESLGNPILAAIFSFAGGLTILTVVFLIFNQDPVPSLSDIRQVPWTRFLGGLCGAFYVLTVIFIVRDIGPANMLCLVVAGQMIAAMTIDHFGFQGFDVHPITLPRILGAVLLIAGVYLIVKN
ncbi:transporter family-2 protein [Dyadobacter jejuensis]|uniref:Transporter family-2 protein n=1 Tax=Dyadobacter jejuensis TaxID=1082580 RepID=A0A316ARK3_9BACT|nr:DMT family transporter [Dyadobacter jejuensis]PWJ59939.1 transporter family-2 protein [Dyadobacter jejuensis]